MPLLEDISHNINYPSNFDFFFFFLFNNVPDRENDDNTISGPFQASSSKYIDKTKFNYLNISGYKLFSKCQVWND